MLTLGFAADCLETLEEIGVENAEYFHAAGGEKFVALPCLNDSVTYDLRSSIAKGLTSDRALVCKPRPPATP